MLQEGGGNVQGHSLPVKLVIRGRGFEVTTEGEISNIERELDRLVKFVTQVSSSLRLESPQPHAGAQAPPIEEEIAVPELGSDEPPVIKPSKSTMENLQLLFSTGWGRAPRSLGDVIKALEVNAIPDSTPNVNTYLRRLVRRGFLRRVQKEGKYCYYKVPET